MVIILQDNGYMSLLVFDMIVHAYFFSLSQSTSTKKFLMLCISQKLKKLVYLNELKILNVKAFFIRISTFKNLNNKLVELLFFSLS